MKRCLANFATDEDGAVTVDFVILTAAICLLSLTVGLLITRGGTDLGNEIETSLTAQNVPAAVTLPAAPSS